MLGRLQGIACRISFKNGTKCSNKRFYNACPKLYNTGVSIGLQVIASFNHFFMLLNFQKERMQMELKQYFEILLERLWILILLPLVAAAAAAGISFFLLEPVYESNTTLYVINRQMDANTQLAYNDMLIGQYLVKDYRELIKSRVITSAVIENLKLDGITPAQLADKISVNLKNDTRILEIRVRDQNPERARDIADEMTKVFAVKVQDLMKVENVSIVDKASLPTAPVEPRPLYNIAIAMFAGLFAAVGIIFLLEYLDDSINTVEDVEKYLDLTVLGTIPAIDAK